MREQDVAFGTLAIERGLVRREAVSECFRAASAAGRSLRDELLARAILSPEQAAWLDAQLAPGSTELPIDQGATVAVAPPAGEPPAPALPGTGDTIGEYEVTGLLGRGGMGMVLRGKHAKTGEPVAIKLVLASHGVDEEVRQRFEREMEAMRRLDRAANVVHVRASGTFGPEKLPYAVMDLVEGQDLQHELDGQALAPERALDVLETVARAVHACHEAGVLHRDLKPDNVLVRASDRRPFVADFGVARVSEMQRLTSTGAEVGTPRYMAPEQALGLVRDQDRRTDVYALGAILYQCLTGQPPHQAASHTQLLYAIATTPPADPDSLTEGLPPGAGRVALKCLAKERGDRYETALELAEDLARVREGEKVKVKLVTPDVVAARAVKRNWLWVAAAVLVALGTPAAWLVRESRRHAAIAADLERARAAGTGAEELSRLAADLEGLGAPATDVADVRRREAEASYDEAAAALAPVAPASRDPVLLGQLATRALAVPGHVVLVGERDGLAVGDALLDRRRALTGEPTRAGEAQVALLVAARALADARLAAKPGEPAALLLRARVQLAASGGPLRALEPGSLDLAPDVLAQVSADLAAARDAAALPAALRGEAAWHLADLALARGPEGEAAAREALAAAIALAPGAPARAVLERALAGPADPATFAALVGELGNTPDPAKLAALSRFLARAGIPDGLEALDFLASPSVASLTAALARDPRDAFAHVPPPPPAPQALDGAREAAERALRSGHNPDAGAQHMIDLADPAGGGGGAGPSGPEKLAADMKRRGDEAWAAAKEPLGRLAREAPWDPETLHLAGDGARPRLSRVLFLLLEARVRERGTKDVCAHFSYRERQKSRDGLVGEWFPAEVFEQPGSGAAACRAFDGQLDRDLVQDRAEFLGVKSPLDDALARAILGARALRRLEALRLPDPETNDAPAPVAPEDRAPLAFEALRGLRGLALLGGSLVLPFRAELRALAFPGTTGESLALLDLARAHRAAAAGGREDRESDYLLFALSRLVTLPAPRPELAPLREELASQIFRLMVGWAHEDAVRVAMGHPPGERHDVLRKELKTFFELTVTDRPSVHGVGRYVTDNLGPFATPTDTDSKRVRAESYVWARVTPETRENGQ